ncbi:MAG: GntR family transcriptional regulator [Acidisphaera sp.]|nr:GntR family transcriptional regulator [Acidisphaera sp.]
MTLRAQAYDAFTRHVLERRIVAGQFVTQRDLATLVGFPLGAIREMIPRLEAEGLVRALAQRGLQIIGAEPRLIHDAFSLRDLIEREALQHYVQTASDAAIAQQVAALEEVETAVRTSADAPAKLARAQAVDWGFHDALIDSMGNALISNLHRVNAIRIRIIMYDRVTLTPESVALALREHRPILMAIQARDAPAALDALGRHLASARRRALGLDAKPPPLHHTLHRGDRVAD